MVRRLFYSTVLAMAAVLPLLALGAQATQDQAQVEAAFVLSIARFTEWPPDAFPGAGDAIRIIVIGDDRFADALRTLSRGKAYNGRGIDVQSAEWDDGLASPPHLLAIMAADGKKVRRILEGTRNFSTLTVGRTRDFTISGGMVRLFVEDGRVRFDVNLDPVTRVGLRISARALQLAKKVFAGGNPHKS